MRSNFCHTNATEAGETEEKVSALSKPLVFRKDSLIKLPIFYYEASQG